MCGRYSSTRARQELLDEFQVELDASEDALEPDYNVAPTKSVPAIIKRVPKDRDPLPEGDKRAGAGETPVRMLRAVRWGLVPSWAKDLSIGNRLINARIETVHEKPSYRRAFARRRCLLPADGFYEWYEIKSQEGGKPRKQPFFIRPRGGGVMAMAGLYELWRDPEGEGEWIWTTTVITTAATDDVGRIHDRMPMIVEPKSWEAWLDPAITDPDEVRRLLEPAMAGRMEAYAVSTAVNNVRNNGPSLVEPLQDGDVSGEYGATLF